MAIENPNPVVLPAVPEKVYNSFWVFEFRALFRDATGQQPHSVRIGYRASRPIPGDPNGFHEFHPTEPEKFIVIENPWAEAVADPDAGAALGQCLAYCQKKILEKETPAPLESPAPPAERKKDEPAARVANPRPSVKAPRS